MKDVFHSFLVAAVLFGGTLAFSQMPDYSPLFSSDAGTRVESLERRVDRLERELRALQASVRPPPAAALKPSLSSGGYPSYSRVQQDVRYLMFLAPYAAPVP